MGAHRCPHTGQRTLGSDRHAIVIAIARPWLRPAALGDGKTSKGGVPRQRCALRSSAGQRRSWTRWAFAFSPTQPSILLATTNWPTRPQQRLRPRRSRPRLGNVDAVLLSHDQHADNSRSMDAGTSTMPSRLAHAFADALIVPVHGDGWAHDTQHRGDLERSFAALGLRSQLRLLEPGKRPLSSCRNSG